MSMYIVTSCIFKVHPVEKKKKIHQGPVVD